MSSFNFNYFLKDLLLNSVILEVWVFKYAFKGGGGGGHNSVHSKKAV